MALSFFTKAILSGEPINVFNHGKMCRDSTYIDDIVRGVILVLDAPPSPDPLFNRDQADPSRSFAPYRVFNIGNNRPVELMTYLATLEAALGRVAEKNFRPCSLGTYQPPLRTPWKWRVLLDTSRPRR
jgi:UDP-glucuronate 4-epimerase